MGLLGCALMDDEWLVRGAAVDLIPNLVQASTALAADAVVHLLQALKVNDRFGSVSSAKWIPTLVQAFPGPAVDAMVHFVQTLKYDRSNSVRAVAAECVPLLVRASPNLAADAITHLV